MVFFNYVENICLQSSSIRDFDRLKLDINIDTDQIHLDSTSITKVV